MSNDIKICVRTFFCPSKVGIDEPLDVLRSKKKSLHATKQLIGRSLQNRQVDPLIGTERLASKLWSASCFSL